VDAAAETAAADVVAEAEAANLTAKEEAADDVAVAMAVAVAGGGNTGSSLGGKKGPVINRVPFHASRAWRGERQRRRRRVARWGERWWQP
jgi:hypothetical protein